MASLLRIEVFGPLFPGKSHHPDTISFYERGTKVTTIVMAKQTISTMMGNVAPHFLGLGEDVISLRPCYMLTRIGTAKENFSPRFIILATLKTHGECDPLPC